MEATIHDFQSLFQQQNQEDDECCWQPPTKKIKVVEAKKVVIIIPIMAERLPNIVDTYIHWSMNGFDVILVATKDDKEKANDILVLEQHNTIKVLSYTPSTHPNAGVAKEEAYNILQGYLDQPNFMYALLLDDTVNNITDTSTGKSIMTYPEDFCRAVEQFTEESPIFGGTVSPDRNRKRCKQGGVVKGGFLQQAIIFSCRGTPTLSKHFKDADEYVTMMRGIMYRKVPFGEDVTFQISLYEHRVLPEKESAQFWGIGVYRIKHESATKRPFTEMEDTTKEALKEMIVYLKNQDALKINPDNNELTGVRVIPDGDVRIYIKGSEGERPWREAYNYTFPKTRESWPNYTDTWNA